MAVYRPTKATIDLGAIRRNTARIIAKYPGYKYYMAVTKADCYGYRGMKVVDAMIGGGANCLAASLLEEGLELRKAYPDLPILLFTPVQTEYLPICVEKGLWVTVTNQVQAEDAAQITGLQVLIRANGGCDIFGGPTDKTGFESIWNTLKNGKSSLIGVYLHSYNAEDEADTLSEYATFETMTQDLDLSSLEIISISNSLSLPRYGKKAYCNACRLGNIIYRIESEDEELEHTFQLTSPVMTVFDLPKGRSVAYSHAYTAAKDGERIAAIPIGFGDGFAKFNIGRDVYINGKRYPIVAVTMDISHILVDGDVHQGDTVYLIRDNHHLDEIASHIKGATEEAICQLNKRVHREYIET